MKGLRIHVTGQQRLSLLVALDDVIAVEGGNEDLEAVRRKLDPNRPAPVIAGQTDIDEMLDATAQLESCRNGPDDRRAKNEREP